MAVGNTFGATALSSYGGFWIAVGIILTPGGFGIVTSLTTAEGSVKPFLDSFGLFLMVRRISQALQDAELTAFCRDGSSSPSSSCSAP